jgi:hypothetical protein
MPACLPLLFVCLFVCLLVLNNNLQNLHFRPWFHVNLGQDLSQNNNKNKKHIKK